MLIDQPELLHKLYGDVVLPPAVLDELSAKNTPEKVKAWLGKGHGWLRVEDVDATIVETVSADLDPGEREAIALAQTLRADYLIIDDQEGRRQALDRKLNVVGPLGVLDRGDQQGLIEDFPGLLENLERAGFRMESSLKALLQERHRQRRNG